MALVFDHPHGNGRSINWYLFACPHLIRLSVNKISCLCFGFVWRLCWVFVVWSVFVTILLGFVWGLMECMILY